MVSCKVRIRFRKAGDLRLVSHHDLMRCFERMLRRADLPFHTTQGFNPKPRLVLALSLALGIVGHEEVAELELNHELPPEEIHTRLAKQAPPGMEILSVRRIAPGTTAHVSRVRYRIALSPHHVAGLPECVAALLAANELWVERTRPQPRRVNLRPYLEQIEVYPNALEIVIRVTPTGSARPEEVLVLLGLRDVLDAGTVLERSQLELEDEAHEPALGGTP
jgi:radical SAM-linked protein